MAIFAGEQLTLIFGEGPLFGECIDAPQLVVLARIPVEALAQVPARALIPVEHARGVFRIFRVPLAIEATTQIEALFRMAIGTDESVIVLARVQMEHGGTQPLSIPFRMPVEILEGIAPAAQLPVDFVQVIEIQGKIPMELIETVVATGQIPIENTGTINVRVVGRLPIETAQAILAGQGIPIEHGGVLVISSLARMPIEIIQQVVLALFRIPIESSGLELSLPITFDVVEVFDQPILVTFNVVEVPVTPALTVDFNIIGQLPALPVSFMVLEPEIVTAFSEDIQCPEGEAT